MKANTTINARTNLRVRALAVAATASLTLGGLAIIGTAASAQAAPQICACGDHDPSDTIIR